MEESKEELQTLFVKVKEESEKAGLKCNIQNTKIMASSLITSWQIDGGKVETVTDFTMGTNVQVLLKQQVSAPHPGCSWVRVQV